MNRHVHRCRHAIGLLAAAFVLFAALAPALTALATPAAGGWTLVCTIRGLERVPAGLDHAPGAPVPGSLLHDGGHCPLCRSPLDDLAPLPSAVPPAPVVAFLPARQTRAHAAPPVAPAGTLPPARAPPLA